MLLFVMEKIGLLAHLDKNFIVQTQEILRGVYMKTSKNQIR